MKNIVIKWAVFLTAFLISLEVSAQNVRVSGVVTDALGPIPGANIMEEGTTNGTVTDVNGKYSISVSAKSTLVFSCIGYKEQKIRVGTKTVLNVDMVEEITAMMTSQRALQSAAQMLRMYDSIMSKSVTDVGRL